MKSVGKVQEFFSNSKCRHPNIKLAVVYPNHNHLPSLDCNVTIYQLGQSFHFNIYIKTFTGPDTNYNSVINSSFHVQFC